MPRINEMFCFAMDDATERDPNDEGVPCIFGQLGPMPLMGADIARVESLTRYAQEIADQVGKPLRIYKFSHKEQIGEVTPRQKE